MKAGSSFSHVKEIHSTVEKVQTHYVEAVIDHTDVCVCPHSVGKISESEDRKESFN